MSQSKILYHVTPHKKLNDILTNGLVLTEVPSSVVGIVGISEGVYLGEYDAVDNVMESIFAFEDVDKAAIIAVHLDEHDISILIPDPELEDEWEDNVYHGWIYPAAILVNRIQVYEVKTRPYG